MANRSLVHETATNPGTGVTVNLSGAVNSRRSFASAFGSGAACFYVLSDGSKSEWGLGTFTAGSPNTLSRTTVIGNTSGTTSRLNFTGVINVYNAIPGEYGTYVGSIVGGNAGGSANDLTASLPFILPSTIPEGTEVSVFATAANTGNMRLNVNGEGLLSLLRADGTQFPAGLIQSGDMIRVIRRGSAWYSLPRADDSVIAVLTPSGDSYFGVVLPAKYNFFEFNFMLKFSSDAASLVARTSTNSGVSYDSGASDYQFSLSHMNSVSTWTVVNSGAASLMAISVGTDNASASAVCGRGSFFPGDGSRYPVFNTVMGGYTDLGAGAYLGNSINTGARVSTTRVNALLFFPSAGTFTGRITVRGSY